MTSTARFISKSHATFIRLVRKSLKRRYPCCAFRKWKLIASAFQIAGGFLDVNNVAIRFVYYHLITFFVRYRLFLHYRTQNTRKCFKIKNSFSKCLFFVRSLSPNVLFFVKYMVSQTLWRIFMKCRICSSMSVGT